MGLDDDERTRVDAPQDIRSTPDHEAKLARSRRLEAVGHLAGGISHDFNNLVGVILGYSELVLDELEELEELGELGELGELPGADRVAGIRADVVTIREAAERARELTRRLLTFSRQDVSAPKVLDMGERVGQVESLVRPLLGRRVELETDLPPGRARVFMDPSEFDRVVMNLVVNARDAMPEGGRLRIWVDTREVSADELAIGAVTHPGTFSVLAIEDTGHGMDAEVRERIFEPFFTTKPADQGTGLGLATVLGVVHQAGGFLRVESHPGEGTCFEVFLPCAHEPVSGVASRSEVAKPGRGETILVVDDEANVRVMHRRMLARAGYRVHEVGGAGEALLFAERHPGPIHLLVTDLGMPLMDGLELTRRMRILRPATDAMIVTGSTLESLREAPDLDDFRVLRKPVDRDELLRVVGELLGEQQLRLGGTASVVGADIGAATLIS